MNVLEAARLAGVSKVIMLGNLLAYPAAAPSPLREESLHDGRIADTHLGIGLAKRNLVLLAENHDGYKNLVRIVSEGHLRSAHDYAPAVTLDFIAERVARVESVSRSAVAAEAYPSLGIPVCGRHCRRLAPRANVSSPGSSTSPPAGESVFASWAHDSGPLWHGPIRFDATKAGGDRSASTDRATRLCSLRHGT